MDLVLECAQEDSSKRTYLPPSPRAPDSQGLAWGLNTWISHPLPKDADDTGLGNQTWKATTSERTRKEASFTHSSVGLPPAPNLFKLMLPRESEDLEVPKS